MTSLLERAIAYLNPQVAAQRAQARAMLRAFELPPRSASDLAYEGARDSRRTQGWVTGGGSADAEITSARGNILNRARDLVRNNAHARKGIEVIVSNKVGTGIICQAVTDNERTDKRIAKAWKTWQKRCDVRGKLDFFGMQALAERTRVESGECLIRRHPVRRAESGDVPFRIEVLEPDYLDSARDTALDDRTGVQVKQGVEFTNGIPTGYWIFDIHPGDNGAVLASRAGRGSKRVSAAEILHYFKPIRPGQSRGVTDFAPVMAELRDFADFRDAKIMRAKIAACSVAAVTTPASLPAAGMGPVTAANDGTQNRFEEMSPGLIHYLKPGEDVSFFDPKPLDDSQFHSDVLHAVAAGLCIPYELLTGDLSQVNYSSARLGLVQFSQMVEVDQWQLLIPQLCDPITTWFIHEYALMDAAVSADRVSWTYTPPRFGLLDPAKEVPPMVLSLQSGIESYPTLQRREGYDWKEKLDEIVEFRDELDKRKLTLTSDARTLNPEPAPAPKKPPAEDSKESKLSAGRRSLRGKIERDELGRIVAIVDEVA